MYFRQLLNDETACASYLLGCKTHSRFAVIDPHVDLVDKYIALADAVKVPHADVERIESRVLSDRLQNVLHQHHGLRPAEAAERSIGRQVREAHLAGEK